MAASTGGTARTRTQPFASAWWRAHLTVDERVARGKAAREVSPRSAHAFAAAVNAGRVTVQSGV